MIDSDQGCFTSHTFKGTTLFGGELSKLHKANKEHASSVIVYPAATPQSYSIKPYPGSGRSFRKGGSSYRKIGRDRDQTRSTPSATFTKPSKSGSGQAKVTVTVPQDWNKRNFQSNEGAPHNKCHHRSDKTKGDKKERGHASLAISGSRGTNMPVCGGMEACYKRSLCVKYRSQGIQTRLYFTPSASDSLGNMIPKGLQKIQGVQEQLSLMLQKNDNLGNISRHSRVLFKLIPGKQGVWTVASSYRLKTPEPPHKHSSLLHAHHKLSAEYH